MASVTSTAPAISATCALSTSLSGPATGAPGAAAPGAPVASRVRSGGVGSRRYRGACGSPAARALDGLVVPCLVALELVGHERPPVWL